MNKIEAVHLFAGPGGLDLGASWAGVEGIGIEWDANAVKTRIANGLPTIHGDVRNYGPADFPDADVFTAGPPCQTFSVAGAGSGRRDLDDVLRGIALVASGRNVRADDFNDERTSLVLEPLRWIRDSGYAYKAIILEQVPTVLPVWEAYAEVLRENGYSVATGVVRAEEYGVPQTRKRAVLVARKGATVSLPSPTHRRYVKGMPQGDGNFGLKPWTSMADVLPHLGVFDQVSNFNGHVLDAQGKRTRGRRGMDEPSFTWVGRMHTLEVLTGLGDIQKQPFTYSDAGVVQSFPATWQWMGKHVRQQIGNACPPLLAEALVRACLSDVDVKPVPVQARLF